MGMIGVAVVFLLCWLANLVFNQRKYRRGVQVTKPMLMPLLMLLYILLVEESNNLVIGALFFGFLGDVCLLWVEKRGLFIGGLVAFLLGHLCYGAVFLESTHFLAEVPVFAYTLLVPYIVYAVLVFRRLEIQVGEMKLPVLLYMGVIVFMSFTSLGRGWVYSGVAFWLPFLGSLSFLISDTVLAFHIFTGGVRNGNVWVMGSYGLAQVLILLGLVWPWVS